MCHEIFLVYHDLMVDALRHLPLRSKSLYEKPNFLYLEAAAPQIECALYVDVSMPAFCILVKIHLLTVFALTAVNGCLEMINTFSTDDGLRFFVLPRYSVKVLTGQMFGIRLCVAKILTGCKIPFLCCLGGASLRNSMNLIDPLGVFPNL